MAARNSFVRVLLSEANISGIIPAFTMQSITRYGRIHTKKAQTTRRGRGEVRFRNRIKIVKAYIATRGALKIVEVALATFS
jgi:hypothetical protein